MQQIEVKIRVPKVFAYVVGTAIVLACLYLLRAALIPVFTAFVFAYLLHPWVRRMVSHGLPRGVAVGLTLFFLAAAAILFFVLVVPQVVHDVGIFAAELPGRLRVWLDQIEPWLAAHGIPIPRSLSELMQQLPMDAGELAQRAIVPAGVALQWVIGGTASMIMAIAALLVIPVFAGYLLYDFDGLLKGIADMIPVRYRDVVESLARDVDKVLSQFVRGQLTVMLILAVLYSVAYSIVGIRLAVPIGLFAGLVSFIPYLGGALALGLGLLMSLIDWTGFAQPLAVLAVYVIIQLLEGFVITPRVVGEQVGLSAVWVLFALMVGGELFGFLGLLLAVPVASVLKILISRAYRTYRQSHLYQQPTETNEMAEPPIP